LPEKSWIWESFSGAKQAAEKLVPEGGGGFNPRISSKIDRALAPEKRFLPISPQILPFFADCRFAFRSPYEHRAAVYVQYFAGDESCQRRA
jgi:hypothetical protein